MIGQRAYFLVEGMDDDDDNDDDDENDQDGADVRGFVRPGLKDTLRTCAEMIDVFRTSNFVLGHRGAALQFPEHTHAGHNATSRMGAG